MRARQYTKEVMSSFNDQIMDEEILNNQSLNSYGFPKAT
jgi:hypothetical protein